MIRLPIGATFRINTLEQLASAARHKSAVVVDTATHRDIPMPAVFVMSMQARCVLDWMRCGMYFYDKGKAKTERRLIGGSDA